MPILLMGATALAASVTLSPGDDVATLTSSLGPGDELVFNPGTYTIASRMTWSGQGTEDQPIVLRAGDGGEVVLEGLFNDWIAMIDEAAWIRIEGLTFRGAEGWDEGDVGGLRVRNSTEVAVVGNTFHELSRTAIYLSDDNSRVTITDNHLYDLVDAHGVYVGCGDASCWTSDSELAGNWIHDLSVGQGQAITLEHGSQGISVLDNVIYNIEYRGLYVGGTESGPQNVIEGNAFWGIGGVGIQLRGAAVVRNNIVFNTRSYGISSGDPGRGTFQDQVITHNTVVETDNYGISLEDWAGATGGMVLANNAVVNSTGRAVYVEGGAEALADVFVSSNVLTGLVDGLDVLSGHFLAGNGKADFVDPDGWDFYPSEGSALINAADPASEAWVPALDFNGLERDGNAPDVGAYERVGPANPGWALQEGFKEFADGLGDPDTEEVAGCCSDEGKGAQSALLFLPLTLLGWRRRRSR